MGNTVKKLIARGHDFLSFGTEVELPWHGAIKHIAPAHGTPADDHAFTQAQTVPRKVNVEDLPV